MSMTPVFLDHNATTPLDPAVRDAMAPWLERPANASSVHRFGRAAREAVEHARRQVAALVGAHADEVTFTSGGTEADNLALRGVLARRDGPLVISAVEHAAVLEPARELARGGRELIELSVDAEGRVEQADLAQALARRPALVSVMWANNETGTLQDIAGIALLCAGAGIPLHSDAVQAAGKIPLDFRAAGIQLMSVSAHKLYGPQGIGALVADSALTLAAQTVGGGQQGGLRGGTEPVALIVGFGAAAERARDELGARAAHALGLRTRLERALAALPRVRLLAQDAQRLPNTVQFTVSEVDGEALLLELDRRGYAVSSGSACASGRREPSHVLQAMGIAPAFAQGAVRVSVGRATTDADIDGFVGALSALLEPGAALAGGGALEGW